MATRLHGVLVDGLNKPLINTTVTLLARQNTLTILNGSEAVFRTDSYGAYNITVQAGHYNMIVGPQGIEPYKVGEIILYADSPEGSLNGYLVNWAPEELTPDVIKQVQQLVANSEEYALQAGRSAAAANADATDARTSKTAAQTAASEALTYKNDAKGSADEAKLAQQGASGSANTATQAVTTINGLKTDVEQLKTDTQGIKDSALTEVSTAKDDAISALTPLKDETVEAAAAAAISETSAASSAASASLSETNAEADAVRSEAAATHAESLLTQSLKKSENLNDIPDKAAARTALEVPPTVDVLLKSDNLQSLADRAAAWLNIRPIGSTPLAGDPVGPYDATTRRWVENLVGAGITGPTMNGVMNYGVGKPSLNASRSYIAPYELPMDGQLVKRADWPELWSYAQMHGAIEDADWISVRTARGQYSKGNGTTTFRLPDWNGKRRNGDMIDGTPFTGVDSIHALFARGDGVDASDNAGTAPGTIRDSAAPNIVGTFGFATQGSTGYGLSGIHLSSAFFTSGGVGSRIINPQLATDSPGEVVGFDASRSSSVYGRDGSPEVRPNSVLSVWVVRASGGFVAANTSWSVINVDDAEPSNSTIVKGGAVRSVYKVGTKEYGVAQLQATVNTSSSGDKTVSAEVVVTNSTGDFAKYNTIRLGTVDGLTGGIISGQVRVSNAARAAAYISDGTNTWEESPGIFRNIIAQGQHSDTQWGLIDYVTDNNVGKAYMRLIPFASPSDFSIFQIDHTGEASARTFTPICDERAKDEIERVRRPLDGMRKIRGVTFRYKDSGIFGIGFTAQDVESVFPEAVSSGNNMTLRDGTVIEGIKRPDTFSVAAALHHESILELMDIMKSTIIAIAENTSDVVTKEKLNTLASKIPS